MYTQTKERLQSHSPAGTMLYDAAVYATAAEVHCGLMKTLEPAENDFVANDAEKSGKAAPYSPMYKRNHCSTPRKASQHTQHSTGDSPHACPLCAASTWKGGHADAKVATDDSVKLTRLFHCGEVLQTNPKTCHQGPIHSVHSNWQTRVRAASKQRESTVLMSTIHCLVFSFLPHCTQPRTDSTAKKAR